MRFQSLNAFATVMLATVFIATMAPSLPEVNAGPWAKKRGKQSARRNPILKRTGPILETRLGRRRGDNWIQTRVGLLGLLVQGPKTNKPVNTRKRVSTKRKVIAHRTGPAGKVHAENKIATGKRAVALGASIEGDVVRLADGTLVVHHDLTGKRTVGDSRRLANLTLAELRETHGDVPTLAEFLHTFRNVEISLDLKFDGESSFDTNIFLVNAAIHAIRAEGIDKHVTLASLESMRGAWLIRSRGYDGPTALSRPELYMMYLTPWLYKRLPFKGDVAQIPLKTAMSLGKKFFRRAKSFGLKIHVWDVDDSKTAEALFEMGADVVETDYPDRVIPATQKN